MPVTTPTSAPRPWTPRRWSPRLLAPVLPAALLLAACGGETSVAGLPADGSTASPSAAPSASSTAAPAPSSDASVAATEVAASAPRLVLTHDEGVLVVDALTLESVADLPLEGFARLNPAGDGRHVVVSTTGGFAVLDAGTWAAPHGDHDHYWTAPPQLSDGVLWPAQEPGHVVTHEGRTALFDDGTGAVVVLDADAVADPDAQGRELASADAHHGVAVELSDGTMVLTEGTADARSTVRVLDAAGAEVARTDDCPGVHGEAVAADEAVVVGCQDGVVVVVDGTPQKVASPDAYGRIGNQAGSEASPVVLGDYKTDPDADLERPTRVSLVDTTTATLRLVDLPASYSFRSLGRGEDGEALVLGTDGALHVIDPVTGELVRSVPVVAPWEEPQEWQQPRPTLHVADGTAYVTEPATDRLHAVDVATGEVFATVDLGVTPNEVTSASGEAEAEHGHDDDHAGEDHADEPSVDPGA